MKYRVLQDYIDDWYNSQSIEEIREGQRNGIDEDEVNDLASAWDKSPEELKEQLEEVYGYRVEYTCDGEKGQAVVLATDSNDAIEVFKGKMIDKIRKESGVKDQDNYFDIDEYTSVYNDRYHIDGIHAID